MSERLISTERLEAEIARINGRLDDIEECLDEVAAGRRLPSPDEREEVAAFVGSGAARPMPMVRVTDVAQIADESICEFCNHGDLSDKVYPCSSCKWEDPDDGDTVPTMFELHEDLR